MTDILVQQAIEIGAWKEKKDDKGKVYYYNTKSKETCWDLAKKFKQDPVKEAIDSGVWKEKKDDKEKSYFYNTLTKETSWDLRKKFGAAPSSSATTPSSVASSDPVAEALASGVWKEKKDDKGKTYYYNAQTKETCWDLAKKLGVSAANTPSAATGDPVADALASGLWKEKKDDKGKTYYYNSQTKETCWDLAKKLGVSAAATPRAEETPAEPPAKPVVVVVEEETEAEKEAKRKAAEEQKKKEIEEADDAKRKELEENRRKKKEAEWKPPPPPAFPPPPPLGRHPSSVLPVYDTTSRRSTSAGGESSVDRQTIDPSKTGGWRNYSRTRWLEELDKRMGSTAGKNNGTLQQPLEDDDPFTVTVSGSRTKDAAVNSGADGLALEMAALTGVISAQETLQELSRKNVDVKAHPSQRSAFVDFRDGASQTVFGPPTADVGVVTLHAASNIAELIPIPDTGIMACSTLESLKKEQERALVLLQHVQGSLASQMQEAGVAFTGHGSSRQLRLNISKPKTTGKQTEESEAASLAKELGAAYRSLQAPPSGPYWRFVTEHESNSLYDEPSKRRARVVQQLSDGAALRHDVFDGITNDLYDQMILREKTAAEYTRVNANSIVDVADFVTKVDAEMKAQRTKEEQGRSDKKALNKIAEEEDY